MGKVAIIGGGISGIKDWDPGFLRNLGELDVSFLLTISPKQFRCSLN